MTITEATKEVLDSVPGNENNVRLIEALHKLAQAGAAQGRKSGWTWSDISDSVAEGHRNHVEK